MLNFWKTIQSKKSTTLSANINNVGLSLTGDGLVPLKDFEYDEKGRLSFVCILFMNYIHSDY